MRITIIPRKRDQHKRRVAAYCRVSTRREEQEDSFEIQMSHYRDYIAAHEEWEYAGIYSDEKSGTKAENRPGFQQIIRDALDGKVDYILVKSISRFSRNIVDCQRYVGILRGQGCHIYFEKEGFDTADPSCSMMFSFLAVTAQDESRSISDSVKWSYRERFRRGEYNLGNNRILGYDSVDGRLVPNRDAWVVKLIFRLFLEGKTYAGIARCVKEAGGAGQRNKKTISLATIGYILRNEAYVGDKLLQKKAPKNFLTKRPERNIEFHSYYMTDDHEAIVDRKTWKAAQEILNRRAEFRSAGFDNRGRNAHFLYSKVICGVCGSPYTRRTCREHRKRSGETVTYKSWTCAGRQKGRKGNGCKNRNIRENLLLEEICAQLRWVWAGAEAFDTEIFLENVERVEIGEHVLVVRKCSPPRTGISPDPPGSPDLRAADY